MLRAAGWRRLFEKIISDYHNHFFDSLVALEKLRQVQANAGGRPAQAAVSWLTKKRRKLFMETIG